MPALLPWSYGASAGAALDAALALWVAAGQPGLRKAIDEATRSVSMQDARLAVAPRVHQANATIVIAEPGATEKEHQVVETVVAAVRIVSNALARRVSTLTLATETGPTLSVAIGSVIEVRDPHHQDSPRR